MNNNLSNKNLLSHPIHRESMAGLDMCDFMDTLRSDNENPPHDALSSGSIFCTSISEIQRNPESVQGRPTMSSLTASRTELVRMEEVVDRLLDPKSRDSRVPLGSRHPNPYRPSILNARRGDGTLTATWCGELRTQNEALADENACAKELTMRDLERLNAAGTMSATGIRGSYNQEESSYVVSCSADMRTYALDEDDLRVPSFLRNRTKIPMRRMQVPGIRQDTGDSSDASNDDSFLEMGFAPISDYSKVVARPPPSVCSSEVSSVARGKIGGLRNSKVAKCVKGLKWRKFQKSASLHNTPVIKEDRDYSFANEPFPFPVGSLLARGTCFMCMGGIQPTKYSVDEVETEPPEENASSVKSADVKSILLTTSPLYDDVNPTPRSQADDVVFSTQQSLNIAATHNPTTELLSSESDDESDAIEDERNIAEIWDDDESDRDSAINSDVPCPMKHWDCSFSSNWEPPTLKTDQEYEMYQLQSRMEAENATRNHLTSQPTSPPSHRFTPDELMDTASMSSWDVKMAREFSGNKRLGSCGSSSWSDLGLEAVPSPGSEFNNLQSR